MSQYSLVYPMAALVLLTVAVMMLMLYCRIQAVRSNKVPASFYRLKRGGKEPERLAAIAQNYQNLHESPILYYAVCILIIALDRTNASFVLLAWAFVGLRVVHSLIHIIYNQVLHRLAAYFASIVVLMAMWLRLAFGA